MESKKYLYELAHLPKIRSVRTEFKTGKDRLDDGIDKFFDVVSLSGNCQHSRHFLPTRFFVTTGQQRYKKVTHCIFDMDGTLLDSEAMYHKGIRHICEKYGKKYPRSLQAQLIGGTDRQICERVVKEAKLPISAAACEAQISGLLRHTLAKAPVKKEYNESRARIRTRESRALMDLTELHDIIRASNDPTAGAQAYPRYEGDLGHSPQCGLLNFTYALGFFLGHIQGAERLLKHLQDHNIPLALATNASERAVLLHAAAKPKLFGMFHHKVCVTDPDVDCGKPNPDLYLVAASRFPDKPKPKDCLVFEDSIIGVQAARAAGMQVVLIPEHKIEREKTRLATMVISSLLLFRPELFGLPPFDDHTDTCSRKFK